MNCRFLAYCRIECRERQRLRSVKIVGKRHSDLAAARLASQSLTCECFGHRIHLFTPTTTYPHCHTLPCTRIGLIRQSRKDHYMHTRTTQAKDVARTEATISDRYPRASCRNFSMKCSRLSADGPGMPWLRGRLRHGSRPFVVSSGRDHSPVRFGFSLRDDPSTPAAGRTLCGAPSRSLLDPTR